MMKEVEENLSNLTSSGTEATASISSSSNININPHDVIHEEYFGDEIHETPPTKKRRNLPGNPDPSAEVIALSPKSLLATNKFVCEICKKGFQRDQNLQLHRRGHNLPWKLKQRPNKEIRKKVYICPEVGCIHHDPLRALGDLTGIKKHFFRKHGEKKWKCEKCSKKYAVQSDWKAHSKTCGTREYRCDCGTLFTRRDSFITHRAFCEALAEESARSTTILTPSNLAFLPSPRGTSPPMPSPHHHEQQTFNPLALRQEIPPWLSCPPPIHPIFSSALDLNGFTNSQHKLNALDQNPNPIANGHMSATALLQKAAQMGATMSSSKPSFALNICPLESNDSVCVSTAGVTVGAHSMLIQDMINSLSSSSPSPFVSFEDHTSTFCGLLSSERERHLSFHEEGMTRDFLGLRPISNNDLLNFGDHLSSHDQDQYPGQKSWEE